MLTPFEDSAHTELGPRSPRSACATYRVVVIAGPSANATCVVNEREPVLVGQSPVCVLKLEGSTVSRRHASLEVTQGRLRITDLRSTNGTTVNGVTIESAKLDGGEVFCIGENVLRIDRVDADAGAVHDERARFGNVVGASPEMRSVYRRAERLAESMVPVLIEGETGTGKEALAEAIHARSPRSERPFVVFDCTASTASLFESELFGHERGAFTGATSTRPGALEQANGGTLLIDEIGELELGLQAKLLRAVETRMVRRVGGTRPIQFDVRILTATRRDLDREVQEGRFRDDLFHRLAVARIEMPALRRRSGDVRLLAQHFWSELGGTPGGPPESVMRRWDDYAWPGNVRELRNAVSCFMALGETMPARTLPASDAALDDSLRTFVDAAVHAGHTLAQSREGLVRRFEKQFVESLLQHTDGDLDLVSSLAGIGRRYLNVIRARVR